MRYSCLALLFIAQLSFAQKKQITLEDIWVKNTFRTKVVPGFNAMTDGKLYTQIDKEGDRQLLRIYDLKTGKQERTIFDNGERTLDGKQLSLDDYAFSKDEKKILIRNESQPIYRRSALYRSYVYDMATGKVLQVDTAKVLHAGFSPDGNKVAFVSGNNLYYKDLKTGGTVAVTTDGEVNKIINGNCDWVYEEEFGFTRAFEWSPDSKHLAFYRFDESNVPQYILPMYTGLYPNNYTYKYPKAGEPNSVVQIKVYDVNSARTVTANVGTETDQYIPRIKWTKDASKLCVYRLNRLQNKLELLLADAGTGNSSIIYTEENPYYVE
ncbi:MAG: dipeptidyl aminopeptidase/acylaminoacyl peptidase, partial [Flavipsychrobacter sp.]|nr:dipeptidyl aminopeptidase/acylaminoacyl peptidase [Flavipsychrobacter sp.]